ncbi:TonB-dependent receptor [Phenylobacterium sp.]|uniref:TonB-dependent receptor domain-containing protein n=1 Tax=Phenylobacterium sp. TaxID=1871053 RepID=UPI00301E535C
MKTKLMRERLLASSMICGAAMLGLATPVAAQDTGAAEVSELIVTGSRIPTPNLTSVSPVQVVGAEEVLLGGRPDTADVLNQLPQVTQNSQTGLSSTSNPLSGPGGVATVDLRGLGQQRTLVLMDGRRLGVGDPNTGNPNASPDINQIPSQLIERIEVLTGGASSTYGSDAVAGVVNFVMKRNYEGVQIDAQWGVYQHNQHNEFVQGLLRSNAPAINVPKRAWDGKSRDLSLVFGLNSPDRRGNVTAFFTYHDQDPVTQGKRDYSACQVNTTAAGIAGCAGSSNSNIFYLADGTGDDFAVLGDAFVPYDPNASTTPVPRFNSNDYSYLMQQNTRYTAGFFAYYEVSDKVELYSDFNFMDSRSNVQIAPTGLFQGSGATDTGGFLVNCDNPFLSGQQRGAIGCTADEIAAGAAKDLYIGRRNIEGGGRNSYYQHQNYRIVGGARGSIVDSWKFDVYGSYYYTSLYQASENYLSIARIQEALLVQQGANGPECISGGSCVPYNIFQDGGVTDAALAYLDVTGTSRGVTTQRIMEAVINGDLGDYGVRSPWATSGVGVAFGVQNRRDHLEYAPDVAQLSGDLSGAGGASTPIDNSISVTEGFGEIRVPLVEDMAFARELILEGGYRYSDYSTSVSADTYKVGLQWAPTSDLRFRGSFQRAIRAPSILELYTPRSVTNTSQLGVDPCAPNGGAAATASLEQCLRTGVTAAQYGNGGTTNTIVQCPSGQCAVLTGGNPVLDPEKAKTVSVGFTLTPGFLPRFVASVDYYRVKLDGSIGSVPLGITMDKCLTTGDPAFCSLISRAPNGTLFGTSVVGGGYIDGSNVNIGAGKVEGLDFQASYALPLEDWGVDNWGGLSLSFAGSYLLKNTTVPLPGDPEYDCAGLFGPTCQTLNPRWKHNLRLNWTTPWDATVSLAWRYIGGVKFERDSGEPTIGSNTTPELFNPRLPARSYVDLSGVWHVRENFSLRAGVNNLFDQDPPLVRNTIAETGLPNTYPVYDLLGRRLFIGFTADF